MAGPYKNSVGFDEKDMLAEHMGEFVNQCVAKHGDKPAFSCVLPTGHSKTLTFSEIGHYSDAVAAYLREELRLVPGDVVAVQSPNALAYPVLAFGILKAGLKITNVNPLYTPDETNHQLKDSGAKIWFVIDVFGDRIKASTAGSKVERVYKISLVDFYPAPQRHLLAFALRYVKSIVPPFEGVAAGTMNSVIKIGQKHLNAGADLASYTKDTKSGDVAIYQYTGGTTGRSKGAELTHGNVVGNISQNAKRGDIMSLEHDTLLLILPLYHVFALAVGAINSMYHGCHVILTPAPRPLSNLKPAFEKFDITVMPGVNTLYQGLMNEKWFIENPVKTFRICMSGAAPLQPATAKAWEKLTGNRILEGYGLTESTCVVSSMPMDKPIRSGSCGVPIPGTDIRIVGHNGGDLSVGEEGELWIKGPQIMKGYLNNPQATADTIVDGWLKTGDVAKVDEDGYLYIVDRIKDMVIVSGFNVYPAEIEDALTRCDKVAEAAVIGVEDADTGERVIAYVVKRDAAVTEQEVIAFCKEHLTGYKVPKTVEFVSELPKSPVGKVLRRELRDKAKGHAAA